MKVEIDKLPPKGYVYAVGDELFFDEYNVACGHILLSDGREFSLEGKLTEKFPEQGVPADVFSIKGLSEVHFFDERAEYRVLYSCGKTRSFLLTESDEINNPDYVIIREDTWIRPEFLLSAQECMVTVINRFEYTDDDRLCLTNYRLSCRK